MNPKLLTLIKVYCGWGGLALLVLLACKFGGELYWPPKP